jgi:dipeptide/tripeptide permease
MNSIVIIIGLIITLATGIPVAIQLMRDHPKGLFVLFFAEMWERFSFYGMRGLLVFYLTQQFLFDDKQANSTFGSYATLVYLLPLIGGVLADRYLGARKAVAFGALLLVVSVAGMGLVDWPLLWGVVFGTFASVHAGIVVGWGAMSARPENRAVGLGVFYTVYYLGGTIVPAICGKAADLVGDASGAFMAAGAISALAVPFWWWHRRMAVRAGMMT